MLILLLEPLVCVQLCFGENHKAFSVWFTVAAKLAHPFLGSPELKIQSPLKTTLHTAGCNSAHSFCCLNSQRSIYRGKPPANWSRWWLWLPEGEGDKYKWPETNQGLMLCHRAVLGAFCLRGSNTANKQLTLLPDLAGIITCWMA